MGIPRNTIGIFPNKHNIMMLCIFVNQTVCNKFFYQLFRKFSFFGQILHHSCVRFTARRKPEFILLHWFCITFCLFFTNQHLHCLGISFVIKLHHKIDRITAFALTMAKPFVPFYSKTVMPFPAKLISTFYQRLSLRA